MSIPNHLAKIKSAGIYRFVWDKSVISPAVAETLRLVVGYSEKGPFNTPVYIEKASDFYAVFGNVSKKLERKGIYFHRLALQALSAGPILALNLKPFGNETVNWISFDPSDILKTNEIIDNTENAKISELYDTNRFWYLDADQLPDKLSNGEGQKTSYMTIAHTDTKDRSCSVIMRPVNPSEYDVTIREWYATVSAEEMPAYLEPIQDEKVSKYFADVYVFRGKFTPELVGEGGPFGNFTTTYDTNDDILGQTWNGYFKVVEIGGNPEEPAEITVNYGEADEVVFVYNGKMDSSDKTIHTWKMKNGDAVIYTEEEENPSTAYQAATLQDPVEVKSFKAKVEAVVGETDFYINPDFVNTYGEKVDALDMLANNATSNFIQSYRGCLIPYFKDGFGNYISLDIQFNAGHDSHNMLMKLDETKLDESTKTKEDLESILYCGDTYMPTEENKDPEYHLKPVYLQGYEYTTITNATTGITLQNKILKMLDDKGIRTALTNRVDVDYHYIVDTFQSYVVQGCKSRFAALAKEKDNAFAILNFPPMNSFINDVNAKFENNGKFDITKIDDSINGFSLPSENEGASHCGFFTSLNFSDGTLKYTVPSAAIVSNNFMKKFDGSLKPYNIIAGPIRGLVSYSGMVGPDYNYGRSDLDVLEPLGVNAIIYVPRKGVYINSNQTAKQTPVSALSKIHIRELVTYIQNEIENMLQNYQWELNTQTLRDTIKTNADYLLGKIMADGGIYAYSTICDSSNNTPEIIDNEMLVLDIAIEPARGAGKMVQQLTIHKTGGITSTAS